MNYKTQIVKRAVKTLIETEDDFLRIKNAITDLQDVYFEITGIKAYTSKNDTDTYLAYGKAVSPIVAANCLHDLMRTKRFIQGIYKAINSKKKQYQDEKLNILYAGSGPYGLLITPLCLLFNQNVFTCTLLDIHKESTNAITKVIKKLGIENYFEEVIHCDAFSYNSPDSKKPHIIIAEVLQMGLRNEPQVALMHHLAPQLREGGVFIPKEIKLDLVHTKKLPDDAQTTLTDEGISQYPQREEEFLGNILSLNTQSVKEQLDENEYPNLKFKPLQVSIPLKRDPNDTLEIQTQLEIFDDIFLTKRQSSLTIPICQTALRGFNDNTIFKFEYRISDKPKVDFTYISAE